MPKLISWKEAINHFNSDAIDLLLRHISKADIYKYDLDTDEAKFKYAWETFDIQQLISILGVDVNNYILKEEPKLGDIVICKTDDQYEIIQITYFIGNTFNGYDMRPNIEIKPLLGRNCSDIVDVMTNSTIINLCNKWDIDYPQKLL